MTNRKMQIEQLIKESIQKVPNWNQVAYIISGLIELFKLTKEEVYLEKIEASAKEAIAQKKPYEEMIVGANSLLKLYELTGENSYKEQIEDLHQQLLTRAKSERNSFSYEEMYVTYPFYMTYETKFNKMNGYMDIYRQFLSADAKADKSIQDSIWFAMALIDTIEGMDEQIFYEYRTLMLLFKKTVIELLEDDHKTEPQKVAMSYLVLKGIRLNCLPERLLANGVETFEKLISLETEDMMYRGLVVLTYTELLKLEKED